MRKWEGGWLSLVMAAVAGVALASLLLSSPALALTVELRPTAVSAGLQVRLDEVARVSDETAGEILLGQAPRPGQFRVFTRPQVALRLRQAGIADAAVEWAGSESVAVRRPGRVVEREEAENLYRDELARLLGVAPERVTLSLTNWLDPVVAEGSLRLTVLGDVEQVTRAVATGTLSSAVSFTVGDEVQVTLRPRAMVKVLVPAVVVREGLNRGEVVRAAQVETVEYELSRLPEGALRTVDEALGRQAVRTLPPGTPLKRADLMAPVVVRRGERVKLLAEFAGLSATVEGLALGDGALGQPIKVQNVQSGRTVDGVVRGPGEVTVAAGAQPVH